MKNNKNLKKYLVVVALGLVCILALSGVLTFIFNLDNHNSQINNGHDVVTRCDLFGHKWVVENGKPATCQEDGYTTAKYCANCDLVELEKIVLPKLNAHYPFYDNGFVSCAFCNKAYGSNYYFAEDFLSTKDTFAEGEYVTLNGTVVLKGCSSGGAKYYLLVAGDNYSEVVRVTFGSAEDIVPFKQGYVYELTGQIGNVGSSYTITNVDAYAELGQDYYLGEVGREDALSFASIESACRANRENYFCKLVYIEDPFLCLSSYTGTTANSVRFDNADVTNSASEYFTFSLRYLREFTDHVNGSVVTFDDVVVKHRDKTAVSTFEKGFFVYLASWGNSNMEFFILYEVDINS